MFIFFLFIHFCTYVFDCILNVLYQFKTVGTILTGDISCDIKLFLKFRHHWPGQMMEIFLFMSNNFIKYEITEWLPSL